MLTIRDFLLCFYLGLNIAIFILFPFILGLDDIDKSGINLKHIIVNILFPLTILSYILMFVIELIIKFFANKEDLLNRIIIKYSK